MPPDQDILETEQRLGFFVRILIEILKYENSKNSKQMPEIELYRNTEQDILETEKKLIWFLVRQHLTLQLWPKY